MQLTENLDILSKISPDIYKKIRNIDISENSKSIKLETARNGMTTIVYEREAGLVYLHSKYDPVTEAERLIGQYKDIDSYKHVFFYGIGMGYHIEAFCKRWPGKRFTLYEPEQSILLSFLQERQLKSFPLNNCRGIYTGSTQADIEHMLQQFVSRINGEVLFVILPSYERVFGEGYKRFLETFRLALTNKKASLQAQTRFQKLWTTNSIRNFSEVINSASILKDKYQYFAGKPAIIAAAGPSLEEELENLRIIRDKGLAYIFSVGSAINTLMANDILPHAACAYDPAPNTNEVIRKIKEQSVDIPLIYGSSVYSETIQGYPGCKLHMLTSQDTISSFFLKYMDRKELHTIIDAPSVTVIVLQMLVMLGCTPVILVGQNFAFRNNRYYAQGIEYKCRPGVLCDIDLDNALEVEDVLGGRVYTSQLFNHMRIQMELFISYSGCKNIINTTKGGAKIKGTIYKPLKELLRGVLVDSIIDDSWSEVTDSPYDISYMISRGKLMLEERESAEGLIDILIDALNILKSEYNPDLLQKDLIKFEQAYNKFVKNHFFNHILLPMNRVQFEMVSKSITDISAMKDIVGKARLIVEIFNHVLEACSKDMNSIKYDFCDMVEEIMENDLKVMSFTIKAS